MTHTHVHTHVHTHTHTHVHTHTHTRKHMQTRRDGARCRLHGRLCIRVCVCVCVCVSHRPIEVDGLLPDQPQTGANAAGGTGDKAGGKGGGGGLPDGLNRGSSLLKTAKYLGKGLAKTTKVFDALGSFMGPMGRK